MHDAAGCRSYIVDPTLGGETDAAVLDFAAKVMGAYGSTLNASVGLGDCGTILDRTGKHHRLVTFHSLLPKGWRRLSLIKLDVEGAEILQAYCIHATACSSCVRREPWRWISS